MIITTELSSEQYVNLWDKYNVPRDAASIHDRINFWESKIQQQHHNLEYFEQTDCQDDYGWYGTITGEEKYVNWFLLQL